VTDIGEGDWLNVRRGPSTDHEIVAQLHPESCAIWWDGVAADAWLRVALFTSNGTMVAEQGWLSASFVSPPSELNRPNASMALTPSRVPQVSDNADPFLTNSCAPSAPPDFFPEQAPRSGDITCHAGSWHWEAADDVCGSGFDAWDRDAWSTTVYRLGPDQTWIDTRLGRPGLSLQC